ncbi:MAG TPA: hypothetical protein VMF66_20135 [Candidatus Acidoferrum sp.]|nr:hypothetical protein [Candidatus Acidoferrum sp.]
MNAQREILSSCGVEASGWDIAGVFFVETTSLQWMGNDDEEVHLRSPLEQGAVIFLRLLHPRQDTTPIAYRAARVGPRNTEGKSCVHLLPLRRRETHKEELARWIEQLRVA